MSVVMFLVLALIVFFSVYQRRILAQHRAQLKSEAEYRTNLLKVSIESQEKERIRIAKELHDNIGASLITTKTYFKQVSGDLAPGDLNRITQKMNELFELMIDSSRSISQGLHPVILDKLGLIQAIDYLAETITESGEFICSFEANTDKRFDKSIELSLYRIVQELFANSIKHSKGKRIEVVFNATEDHIKLHYQDDGVGIQTEKVGSGIGLKNIESRLSVLNGTMTSIPNHRGFCVEISLKTENVE